jgi:hypothetical protein
MAIKARFYVAEFNKRVSGVNVDGTPKSIAQVIMQAVNRKTDDNINWSEYSPSGKFEILLTQKEGGAFETFESLLGKDVSITIEEAVDQH